MHGLSKSLTDLSCDLLRDSSSLLAVDEPTSLFPPTCFLVKFSRGNYCHAGEISFNWLSELPHANLLGISCLLLSASFLSLFVLAVNFQRTFVVWFLVFSYIFCLFFPLLFRLCCTACVYRVVKDSELLWKPTVHILIISQESH